jgi:hypothetical protein
MQKHPFRSEIYPAFDGGLLDNNYVKGGVFIRKTKALRNAIGPLYRRLDSSTATLCFVEADNVLYKLINNPSGTTTDADWTPISFANSALIPVGNWDKDNTDPVLTDAGAAGRTGEFYFVVDAPTATVVTHAGLFGGNPTSVSNGMYIVSVGTAWIPVSNAATWDAMAKPAVITDYVNGTVISHQHSIADILDLQTELDSKFDIEDTADHTIDFDTVPDEGIVEVEFLKAWYYNKEDVDQLLDEYTSGITTFLALTDTPSSYAGHDGKVVRVNSAEDGLEFADGLFWNTEGNTILTGNIEIYPDVDATYDLYFGYDSGQNNLINNLNIAAHTVNIDAAIGINLLTETSVYASMFYVRDATNPTKRVNFDASGITNATTRTYTLPDASGTLALTSDYL